MDPYIYRRDIMAEDNNDYVTVVDVYDQAAGIGKEFEKLIETFGVESVTDLMPKVIKSLEHLETLAARYEKEAREITDLKFLIEKLEEEKNEKAQERLRYEQELEQIEENYQAERNEMIGSISKLQNENHRLYERLQDQKKTMVSEMTEVARVNEEREIEVLTKLKETVDKQREELKKFKREIKQKKLDSDALESQLEQIVKVNAELRRKNNTHKKQAKNLLEERVDMEAQLVDKEQQIKQITELVKEQSEIEETRRLPKSEAALTRETSIEVEEDDSVRERLESEGSETEQHIIDGFQDEFDGENMALLQHKLSTIGKMVIDMKDPNRPRFTLNELRTVLMERNELKAKLLEVEDELSNYKPKSATENEESSPYDSSDEEERPVQGPINKEPEEKMYPGRRRESGIRKFFRSVFGNTSDNTHGRTRSLVN